MVGYALFNLEHANVPWQRVINVRGRVSERAFRGPEFEQRRLLEDEGVQFDVRGRVSFARYRWRRGL